MVRLPRRARRPSVPQQGPAPSVDRDGGGGSSARTRGPACLGSGSGSAIASSRFLAQNTLSLPQFLTYQVGAITASASRASRKDRGRSHDKQSAVTGAWQREVAPQGRRQRPMAAVPSAGLTEPPFGLRVGSKQLSWRRPMWRGSRAGKAGRPRLLGRSASTRPRTRQSHAPKALTLGKAAACGGGFNAVVPSRRRRPSGHACFVRVRSLLPWRGLASRTPRGSQRFGGASPTPGPREGHVAGFQDARLPGSRWLPALWKPAFRRKFFPRRRSHRRARPRPSARAFVYSVWPIETPLLAGCVVSLSSQRVSSSLGQQRP